MKRLILEQSNDEFYTSHSGLALGKSDFEAITAMQGDDYFKQALAIGRLPSAESLRQRLDATAKLA